MDNLFDDNITFFGKIAKLPKNSKASTAMKFMENIKISKQKTWYILVEKQDNELQMIKYNNKLNINLKLFVEKLKEYYNHDEKMSKYVNDLEISGESNFSSIKNIPNVEINGKKLISIISMDLIKLLI